ncbi:hypothetical protein PF002_g31166 [Phytophthora fragariae]|uniref:Uncharacterized protein n=1 Tax=Phytophthora fragariae TaxID=53985 RepID=A0A6A3VRV8_9STRA|nr:hypothetical protein PF003_g10656 [Phytophthora fragariae]KAE8918585.1 hypothetical protein PF009_g31102 [Phytophthora fragariae]KAE9166232.1 hypothetical protein PF002_g31166 [Phytophthora fragariae]
MKWVGNGALAAMLCVGRWSGDGSLCHGYINKYQNAKFATEQVIHGPPFKARRATR